MTMRRAAVVAVSLNVSCPWCFEPQPEPDGGSHLWSPDQMREVEAKVLACVSCGRGFSIGARTRVPVE